MERYICIHGHFYQPPRENAWLEFVELQDSAYPYHDWNERISAECYAPNGMSRILSSDRNIEKITNNYAHISFNFGPTLLAWMAEKAVRAYKTVLDADKESQQRFSGHGSAIAQGYNHAILPLCNGRDKYTQVLWGIRDFEHRFGRQPEGMWLPETAVDLETLDILAELGIRFTILSPYQAKRTRKLRSRTWRDTSGAKVDPSMPYEVHLPSGKRIAVFFYDGPISQAIAFERLLDKGENLAGRLLSAFSDNRTWPQIVHIATDGETYGHHHKQGDMALAYALHHIETNNLARLTNYGEFLALHPPTYEAEIWERSAWSCPHGVERWNSNCGCNSGGYADWNQEWRGPLRQAFDWLRDRIAAPFETKGKEFFRDPWETRNDYIQVILDRTDGTVEAFFGKHAVRKLSEEEKITALKLMEMQRHAMLMYTSCGWFFDELSGIETTQVIQYAARTVQLHHEVFGETIEPEFLDHLERAKSNIPENKDGRAIYEKFVRPAMIDRKKGAAHYGLMALFEPYPEKARVYCFKVELEDSQRVETESSKLALGKIRVSSVITRESNLLSFGALHIGDYLMNCGVADNADDDYSALKQEIIDPFNRADFDEVIRVLDRHFGESTYSLRSIFHDDQRKILNTILKSTLAEAEAGYRQMYETHGAIMRFVTGLNIPPPREFSVAAEFALNSSLRKAFQDLETQDFSTITALLDEARDQGVRLDGTTLGFALRRAIKRLTEQLVQNDSDLDLIKKLESATALARNLPFPVSFWRAQNNYYHILQKTYAERVEKAKEGDAEARAWVEHFAALGRNLSVKVDVPAMPELQLAS